MTNPGHTPGSLIRDILISGLHEKSLPRTPEWGETEWTEFLRAAHYHGVAPLIHHIGGRADTPFFPESIQGELSVSLRTTAARNLLVTRDLVLIAKALHEAGIPFLLLKGLALACTEYGNKGLRSAGDIDLLMSPDQVKGAAATLERLGWKSDLTATGAPLSSRRLRIDYECHFQKSESTPVDLHWAVAPLYMGFNVPFTDLWEKRGHISIAGVTVDVPGRADLAWYLACHGSRHLWCRWIWLYDLALVLRQIDDGDRARLESVTRTRGNATFIDGGIALVADSLEGPPSLLTGRPDTRRMTVVAGRSLLLTHRPPSNNTDFPLCHARMLDSIGARLKCIKHLLQNAAKSPGLLLRATPEDRRAVPLPKWLTFAYPIVRIARLLRRLANPARDARG